MIQRDKLLHFLACAAITFFVIMLFFIVNTTYGIAALAGIIASSAAGWGKEFGDKTNPNNSWDWKDIIADAIGTVFGLALGGLLWLI